MIWANISYSLYPQNHVTFLDSNFQLFDKRIQIKFFGFHHHTDDSILSIRSCAQN